MGISVTIQTYNRADELRRTLTGLSKLDTRGAPPYEVLVVDNNSQDDTAHVVGDFHSEFGGHLRYVLEPRQGLSHARNRAVAESRYEIVAFLDDDVEVASSWLRNLAAAYESGDHAAIGGPAHLAYPGERPGWLDDRTERFLTKVDCGPVRRSVEADEICGVNFSIRKQWVAQVGGFRTDLGRLGSCLLGSEETDLLERIAQAGGKLIYEPTIKVGHRVPLDRLRRRWFWSRCYWGGRGLAQSLPDSQVSCYQAVRATWHVALMSARAVRTSLSCGIGSAEPFFHTQQLASSLGIWVGVMGRLCRWIKSSTPPASPVQLLSR
jgi:glucosyl-dolichyl phosphate glucuronosyltransferase